MSNLPNEQWRAVISGPVDIHPFAGESSAFAVEVGATSICGKFHPQNTDHYLAIRLSRVQETLLTSLGAADLPPRFEEYSYAMVVADGLEGRAGARASRVALSALAHLAIQYGKWNVRVDPDVARDIFAQGQFLYARAHDAVRQASRADERLANMATSLTALYIAEDNLFFAHVGHSAAFLFRDGVLIPLTNSHASGAYGVEADFTNGLYRTIGRRRAAPRIDTEHIKLLTGDRVLLCTDGLTNVVTHERIADTLACRRAPKEDCDRLIDLAIADEGPDDVTAIVADYTLRRDGSRPDSNTPIIHSPDAQAE
ncbi:MAG TPA: SpoIIE family protein phosphatase [Pirellulales bacterium]|nr:SpoIIE family protein phosphatase [Pirellulales bacterium]